MFSIGDASNVFTAEGSASAGTGRVTVSAPYRTLQVIISNDSSGANMQFIPMGSAAAANQIMTIGGGESLSWYFRTNTVNISAGTAGVGYRVWMIG